MNFASDTISQLVGIVGGSLDVNGTENGFQHNTTLTPVNITVFDSARLALVSVTGADTVSQDMNLDLAIQLTNNGADNANALIDSVVISELGFSQVVDSVLGANESVVLNVSAFVDTIKLLPPTSLNSPLKTIFDNR